MAGTSFIVVAGGITNANEVTNTVEMIELRLEDHEDHGKDDHYWKTGKKYHIFHLKTVKGAVEASQILVNSKIKIFALKSFCTCVNL